MCTVNYTYTHITAMIKDLMYLFTKTKRLPVPLFSDPQILA